MSNGSLSDHDLLVRIDTTVNTIKAEYIDKDKLENKVNTEIVTHERKMHKGVSWALIGQVLVAIVVAGIAIFKMLG